MSTALTIEALMCFGKQQLRASNTMSQNVALLDAFLATYPASSDQQLKVLLVRLEEHLMIPSWRHLVITGVSSCWAVGSLLAWLILYAKGEPRPGLPPVDSDALMWAQVSAIASVIVWMLYTYWLKDVFEPPIYELIVQTVSTYVRERAANLPVV